MAKYTGKTQMGSVLKITSIAVVPFNIPASALLYGTGSLIDGNLRLPFAKIREDMDNSDTKKEISKANKERR